MTIAKEHFARFNHDENKFLNCIVSVDEMLAHHAKPETKPQSKQWKRIGSPPPKKFTLSASAVKVMLFYERTGWDQEE